MATWQKFCYQIIDSIAFNYCIIIQKAFCSQFLLSFSISPKLAITLLKPKGHCSNLILLVLSVTFDTDDTSLPDKTLSYLWGYQISLYIVVDTHMYIFFINTYKFALYFFSSYHLLNFGFSLDFCAGITYFCYFYSTFLDKHISSKSLHFIWSLKSINPEQNNVIMYALTSDKYEFKYFPFDLLSEWLWYLAKSEFCFFCKIITLMIILIIQIFTLKFMPDSV